LGQEIEINNLQKEYAILETVLGNEISTEILGYHRFMYGNRYAEANLYDHNALKLFRDEILYRRQHKYDNLILNSGEERDGKTTWSWNVAELVEPNFPVDNIAFTLEELDSLIESANEGEQIIMDEAGHAIFALDFMKDFQRLLVRKMQVIGKRRLIVYLNLPHKQDLTKRLRDRRVTSWNHVFIKKLSGGILDRGYCEIRLPEKSKYEQFIWWRLLLSCRFPQITGRKWDIYEERKDIFIASVSSTEKQKIKVPTHAQKIIEQRNLLIQYLHDNGYMNQTEIALFLKITQGQVSNILKKEIDENIIYGDKNNGKI